MITGQPLNVAQQRAAVSLCDHVQITLVEHLPPRDRVRWHAWQLPALQTGKAKA